MVIPKWVFDPFSNSETIDAAKCIYLFQHNQYHYFNIKIKLQKLNYYNNSDKR